MWQHLHLKVFLIWLVGMFILFMWVSDDVWKHIIEVILEQHKEILLSTYVEMIQRCINSRKTTMILKMTQKWFEKIFIELSKNKWCSAKKLYHCIANIQTLQSQKSFLSSLYTSDDSFIILQAIISAHTKETKQSKKANIHFFILFIRNKDAIRFHI